MMMMLCMYIYHLSYNVLQTANALATGVSGRSVSQTARDRGRTRTLTIEWSMDKLIGHSIHGCIIVHHHYHHVKRLFASLFLISVCITQVGQTKNTEINCFSIYLKTVVEQRIKKSN